MPPILREIVMKFSTTELQFIIQCVEEANIKGRDAVVVGKMLEKMIKKFKQDVEKESAKKQDG